MNFHGTLRAAAVLAAAAICIPAEADSLQEAIGRAYDNNPDLAGNRALARAADEVVTQAEGAYGPSLSVSARHEFTLRRTVLGRESVEDEGFGTSVSATLSQPLFTSGRLAAGLDGARAGQMIARESLRASSQQLVLGVVNAYVSLQRDIALYGVAVEIHGLLRQQQEVTLSRFALRDSTQPDVDQTTNRMQIAAGRVIAARAAVEASAARYRNLVGKYPEGLAPLPDLTAPSAIEALYGQAEAENPVLAAARFTERRSRAAVAAARSEMGPQVSAFAAAERAPLTPFQNTRRAESIAAGVGLSLPLYSGGQLSAALREAIARNAADQQFLEQTRRDVRETLATDWHLLQAANEALPRYEAAVRAAERAVEGVKKQETAGIRTLRDVLEVTNDLLTARTNEVQTRAELYIRKAAVLRDTGLLTIDMFTDRPVSDADLYRPPAAGLAGLPLRPVLDPIDRLLLNSHVPRVRVDVENDRDFHWSESEGAALQPPP